MNSYYFCSLLCSKFQSGDKSPHSKIVFQQPARSKIFLDCEKAKLIVILALLAVAAVICDVKPNLVTTPAQAKPAFMDRYNRDAYAKRDLMGKCTVCHIGRGGDRRNDFGEAFEDAGYRITPKLRKKFPGLFERSVQEQR